MKPTLLFAAGRCLNAPEGVVCEVRNNPYFLGRDSWEWSANWSGALLTATGKDYLTRDAAICTLEATLWRNGVLPLPDWFKSPDPDEPYTYSCNVAEVGAWVERTPDAATWYWTMKIATEPGYARGRCNTMQEAMHRVRLVMRAVIADELLKVTTETHRPHPARS